MNELEKIEQEEKLKIELENYKGPDRVILAEDKLVDLEEERKRDPGFVLYSGITSLDQTTDGFRRGQLILVSGPTKNGKTQFCQTLTSNFVEQGHQCLWFSYELAYEELFGKFPMEKLEFYVPNHMESGNLEWIERRIVEAKVKYNLHAVFIDHLDFLKDDAVLRQNLTVNTSSYVGAIVQRIKSIAVKHGITVFLMAHIRKNKWSTNELPTSEDIRDSGQIPQLSDLVMMIIRKKAPKEAEEVYQGTSALLGVIENRHNGKTKKIPIKLTDNKFYEDTVEEFFKDDTSFGEW